MRADDSEVEKQIMAMDIDSDRSAGNSGSPEDDSLSEGSERAGAGYRG